MYFELKTCCEAFGNEIDEGNIKINCFANETRDFLISFMLKMNRRDKQANVAIVACPFCGHTKGLKRIR